MKFEKFLTPEQRKLEEEEENKEEEGESDYIVLITCAYFV